MLLIRLTIYLPWNPNFGMQMRSDRKSCKWQGLIIFTSFTSQDYLFSSISSGFRIHIWDLLSPVYYWRYRVLVFWFRNSKKKKKKEEDKYIFVILLERDKAQGIVAVFFNCSFCCCCKVKLYYRTINILSQVSEKSHCCSYTHLQYWSTLPELCNAFFFPPLFKSFLQRQLFTYSFQFGGKS